MTPSSVQLVMKAAKLGAASFALSIASSIVLVGVAIALGLDDPLAMLVGPRIISLILGQAVVWAFVIRKRLS